MMNVRQTASTLSKRSAIVMVKLYQLMISPIIPPCCRFYPTCSCYAIDALQKYGVIKGSWLALLRLARCHPFHAGGYDPVPIASESIATPGMCHQSAHDVEDRP